LYSSGRLLLSKEGESNAQPFRLLHIRNPRSSTPSVDFCSFGPDPNCPRCNLNFEANFLRKFPEALFFFSVYCTESQTDTPRDHRQLAADNFCPRMHARSSCVHNDLWFCTIFTRQTRTILEEQVLFTLEVIHGIFSYHRKIVRSAM